MTLETILPPNSTPQEFALEQAIRPGDEVRAAVDKIRTSKETPPDDWLMFLVWEYGLEELLPYFPELRPLITAGIPWIRIRGTPASVLTALGWLNLAGDPSIEAEDATSLRWYEYMIEPGSVPVSRGQTESIVKLARLSAPVGTRLSRLYHGYDVRRFVLDQSPWGDLLSDYSGVYDSDLDVVLSFGRVTTSHAELGDDPQVGTSTERTSQTHHKYEDKVYWDYSAFGDVPVLNYRIGRDGLTTIQGHGVRITQEPAELRVMPKAAIALSDGFVLGDTNACLFAIEYREVGAPDPLSDGQELSGEPWNILRLPIDERFDRSASSQSTNETPPEFAGQKSREITSAGWYGRTWDSSPWTMDPWDPVLVFAQHFIGPQVNQPSITSPANGATDIPDGLTLTSSAFSTANAPDTHVSSRWQVKTVSGSWDAPLHDSGDSVTDKTSHVIPAGVLDDGSTEYVARVLHTGNINDSSVWSDEVHFTTKESFAKIIGIVLVSDGGGSGTWARIDENYAAYSPAGGYFGSHTTFSGIQDQTVDGQSMVRVPKFWVKHGTVPSGAYAGKRYWMISDVAYSGFSAHPAFMSAGSQVDQFWIGKYQASLAGGKLCSATGVAPAVSTSFNDFTTYAAARNTGGVTGFQMWDIHQLSAIKLLSLIEHGTPDLQAAIGNGRVSAASVANVDASDVAQATYRGIVGLWGNIDQIIDGLKTDASGKYQIFDTAGNRTYKTSSAASPASGWPTSLLFESGADYSTGLAFLPATTSTTASAASLPDYLYRASSRRCSAGGYYVRGSQAGIHYLDLANVTDTGTGGARGTRLAKI